MKKKLEARELKLYSTEKNLKSQQFYCDNYIDIIIYCIFLLLRLLLCIVLRSTMYSYGMRN